MRSTRIRSLVNVTTRPGLDACLKALRGGDVLVIWKLDRLGRDLRHLVNVVKDLTDREIGLRVLAGQVDKPTHAIRKIMLRMESWKNFVM